MYIISMKMNYLIFCKLEVHNHKKIKICLKCILIKPENFGLD